MTDSHGGTFEDEDREEELWHRQEKERSLKQHDEATKKLKEQQHGQQSYGLPVAVRDAGAVGRFAEV